MNILNIEHVSKVFGDKVIFDDVSYGIHEGDKIGIIGINGTGKTTLLKIIAGLEETDEGQVICQRGLRVAYLPQNPEFPENATVLSYVTGNPNVAMAESDAKAILNRLDVTDYEAEISHLSGGQKKRVALARTLVEPADVLVQDEPTNHVDNEMAAWLEDYLNRFRGVVVMVTHDRYFLDRVTNKILEMLSLWNSLAGRIDREVFRTVAERLGMQLDNAKEWRDQVNTYFYRKSGIPDEKGRKIY